MASIVSDIVTAVKTTISTTLGGSYQELRYVYDVTKNDTRAGRLAYGLRPLAAAEAEDKLLRAITLNHGFEVILTDTLARSEGDGERTTAILTMYNKADEIFKALVNTKAGAPTYVLVVNQPSISEPEFLDDNKLIVLRMQINIRYRSLLS